MNYTLHQLQVFLKVAELKSITKAAEALFLSQPAVSIQLKNFQDQFEIPLYEVLGRKLYITEFGYEIAKAAENIIDEVYAINFKTLEFKGLLSGRLKMSVVSTGKYVIPYFLTDFLKINGNIELQLDVTNKLDVIESLNRNEADFALVSLLPKELSIEAMPLLENKLYLVGNRDCPDFEKESAQAIFEKLPFIYRENGSGTRSVMEYYFDKMQYNVTKKLELTSNEAVKQSVIAGLGYSIMPIISIKNELQLGDLKIIPIAAFPIITNWQLIWLKNKKMSPVANAYLTYLNTNLNNIVANHFEWASNF